LKRISRLLLAVIFITPILIARRVWAAEPGRIQIDLNQTGDRIGGQFFGLMTEEINHSYDGGLYAELVRNRIFADSPTEPDGWSLVKTGTSSGEIELDTDNPVNSTALKTSLRLKIDSIDAGGRVGVANTGYWGIPVWPTTRYHASFYARSADGFSGPLTLTIEKNDGSVVFAAAKIDALTGDWKKYTVDLNTTQVAPSADNRLVLSAASKGTLWFSLVSLFPPTYNDRPNGNRIDLMRKLADLRPAFLRFPGGNYLEGDTIPERFEWKNTIGPLEDRAGHQGPWHYRSSDGLGLLEFLDWCEDLHMEPLLAVYAGYSLRQHVIKAGPELQPFVDDALDEIEYCTGDASTKWGARRAADGHPAPFIIHYVEIGNEDGFDKSKSYDGRFAQFFNAIKAKYPNLQCIATAAVHSVRPDLVDDHAYPKPDKMLKMVERYDHYDSSKPKVFFGEWATQDGKPTPTLRAALADAAWMIGMQRDSGTVLMNCYAPLLVNVNKGAWQWPTNLIGYDALSSFGSPSYYAQLLFSHNWGDVNLATQLTPPPNASPATAPTTAPAAPSLFAAASREDSSGEVILKVANTSDARQTMQIELANAKQVARDASVQTLTGQPGDANTVDAPQKIAPEEHGIANAGASFTYEFPAYSISVIRLKVK
jgi:alpha-N-arabinofuranosidase